MTDNNRIEEILEKSPDPDNYTIARIVYQKETPDDLERMNSKINRFVEESFVPALAHSIQLVGHDHPRFKSRVLNPWFVDALRSHLDILTRQDRVTSLLDNLGKDRMFVTLKLKGEERNASNWPVSPKGSIVVEVFNNADRYPSDNQPKKSGMIQVFQLEVPIFLVMGS